jgi:hypothetical protein
MSLTVTLSVPSESDRLIRCASSGVRLDIALSRYHLRSQHEPEVRLVYCALVLMQHHMYVSMPLSVQLQFESPFARYSPSCPDALQQRLTEAPGKQSDPRHMGLEPSRHMHSVLPLWVLGVQQERAALGRAGTCSRKLLFPRLAPPADRPCRHLTCYRVYHRLQIWGVRVLRGVV